MKAKITKIAVDFDGVLSNFNSGWKSSRDTSDPPVDGAIVWLSQLLQDDHFEVIIYSARNFRWGGKKAIKRWLHLWGLTKNNIKKIKFPWFKPVCSFLLDDRVMCFKGKFPSKSEILNFKPWHGKGIW